ncbi:MAG: hypothetical protein WB771_01390 [Solirubrobacterales bacterium]
MTPKADATSSSAPGPIALYEQSVIERIRDFDDPHQEWRRLFSELGALRRHDTEHTKGPDLRAFRE